MKKVILTLSAVALVGAYASAASAQCDFNAISKAKGLKGSMIRAFAGCPSTEHPAANTVTGGGVPGCTPVVPKGGAVNGSHYMFDPGKGSCSVQTQSKITPDCSQITDDNGDPLGLPVGPCHVTYVKGKCSGILQADGLTPINASDDAGWKLATLTRATLDDSTNGDMTVLDFPVSFPFDDPSNGKISVSGNSAEALSQIVSPTSAALPTCTQLEIVNVWVRDSSSNHAIFASLGSGTRDKTLDAPAP